VQVPLLGTVWIHTLPLATHEISAFFTSAANSHRYENCLGAAGVTVKVATTGEAVLPLLVCNAPAGSELMKLPPFGAVTGTVMVHEPRAGIEPPAKVTDEVLNEIAPPQVLVGSEVIVTPAGKVSVSGEVILAILASELLNVSVSVEASPAPMVAGSKALLRVGKITALFTVNVAMAGAVLFPLLVTNAPTASELMKLPPVAAVTGTVMVHDPLAGIDPPVKVTDEALNVMLPPHELVGVEEIVTPAGKVSVRGDVMLAALALGLLNVIVRVEAPPALMVAGLNALASVGADPGALTVKVATTGAALLPLLVTKAPAGIELRKLPPLGAVTGTVMVHEPLAGIDPPVNVTAEALNVIAPPQVLLGVEVIVTPLGKVSVNGDEILAALALELLNVIVRVDAPPALMTAGLNALLTVGATTVVLTVKVATAGTVLLPLLVTKAPTGTELM